LKKNDKKFLKRGKKERNEEKLKKMMQKDVLYCVADFNPLKGAKICKVERATIGASEWLTC